MQESRQQDVTRNERVLKGKTGELMSYYLIKFNNRKGPLFNKMSLNYEMLAC